MPKLKFENTGLTPAEIQELVVGAQTFLSPVPDLDDEDKLTPEETPES